VTAIWSAEDLAAKIEGMGSGRVCAAAEIQTIKPGNASPGRAPGTVPTESQLGRVACTAGEATDATAQLTPGTCSGGASK